MESDCASYVVDEFFEYASKLSELTDYSILNINEARLKPAAKASKIVISGRSERRSTTSG